MKKLFSNMALALFFAFFALSMGAFFIYDNSNQGATFSIVGLGFYIISIILKPRL